MKWIIIKISINEQNGCYFMKHVNYFFVFICFETKTRQIKYEEIYMWNWMYSSNLEIKPMSSSYSNGFLSLLLSALCYCLVNVKFHRKKKTKKINNLKKTENRTFCFLNLFWKKKSFRCIIMNKKKRYKYSIKTFALIYFLVFKVYNQTVSIPSPNTRVGLIFGNGNRHAIIFASWLASKSNFFSKSVI